MPKGLKSNTASVTTSRAQLRQIGFLPLLALFYGYTAGGPFGYEEIFQGFCHEMGQRANGIWRLLQFQLN